MWFPNSFWDSSDSSNKTHWISWDELCQQKSQRGLGFQDFALFNQSILAKQAWRIVFQPASLVAKFFNHCSFLEVNPCKNKSYIWRGILCGKALLDKGLGWHIGNGRTCKIWDSNQVSGFIVFKPFTSPTEDQESFSIADLLKVHNQALVWDKNKLHQNFLPIDVDRISSILLGNQISPDVLAWLPNWDGIFSVKHGYYFAKLLKHLEFFRFKSAQFSNEAFVFWKKLWRCVVALRIIFCAWQEAKDRLPTNVNLFKRKIILFFSCGYYKIDSERLRHILYDSPFAQEFWSYASPKCTIIHAFAAVLSHW